MLTIWTAHIKANVIKNELPRERYFAIIFPYENSYHCGKRRNVNVCFVIRIYITWNACHIHFRASVQNKQNSMRNEVISYSASLSVFKLYYFFFFHKCNIVVKLINDKMYFQRSKKKKRRVLYFFCSSREIKTNSFTSYFVSLAEIIIVIIIYYIAAKVMFWKCTYCKQQ